MNIVKFEEMKKKYGERVVWCDDGEYCFSMNDVLDVDESSVIEDKYEGVEGVRVYMGYGDDVMNCVSVKVLEDMDEELEEFIVKYVGVNCYSEE